MSFFFVVYLFCSLSYLYDPIFFIKIKSQLLIFNRLSDPYIVL